MTVAMVRRRPEPATATRLRAIEPSVREANMVAGVCHAMQTTAIWDGVERRGLIKKNARQSSHAWKSSGKAISCEACRRSESSVKRLEVRRLEKRERFGGRV